MYGENTVNRTTVNRWAIKFNKCEPSCANIVDQPRSGRPVSVTNDKHQKQVDELIKHGRFITHKQIAGGLGMSKRKSGLHHWFTWLHKSLFSMGATHVDTGINAEVWGSLPSALQPWLGAKLFPFLSSPQGGSQGDSFHLMMMWSKLWRRGSNKELLNSSLTACVNLFYVGKTVLNAKATISKNKYVNL